MLRCCIARIVVWIGFVVPAAGCYVPDLVDCTVRCAGPSDCAARQTCDPDGYCAAPGAAGRCATPATPADASALVDAAIADSPRVPDDAPTTPDDAPTTPCQAACPGKCEGATCVIECTATGSCDGDVTCPAGLPCRIVCGDDACKRVDCELASSCDIECTGEDSCAERVRCGLGRCEVKCTGEDSCRKGVDCRDACACDVTCSGDDSCGHDTRCPDDRCEHQDGCRSQGETCDRCG